MTKPLKILAVSVLTISAGLFVLSIVLRVSGIYLNTTASLPVGFYKIVDAPIAKGAYVAFCPPQMDGFSKAVKSGVLFSGNCPGGYGQLLKQVYAVENDHVRIDRKGISINGELLPNTAQVTTNPAVIQLPQYTLDTVLNEFEYLLLADLHPHSLDARYFGPSHQSQILHVVRAQFIWNSHNKESSP
ncbi:conjugative transfer signal peptidase TraF [Nitrosomonas aestuarii]|uniref:conjugative transfer signal peptidase TraF n=1 Tax=Nitrosomonas aestuarii TaxID=52441 RepID=UPI000D2F77DD|nr:conjugative transfer signal peptidase TraF [Nitrosomonas aestuarii]PTN12446.1 conjugative transfer signal peptidase TraF [Nitrosomonas aestuarii]